MSYNDEIYNYPKIEFINGYDCLLCGTRYIKSRYIHLMSRLHAKNLEAYEKRLYVVNNITNAEKTRRPNRK